MVWLRLNGDSGVTEEKTTMVIRIGTLLVMLNLTVLIAYWAGGLANRVDHLEQGKAEATADRWTKQDDDNRHELVMYQLNAIKILSEKNFQILEKMQHNLWMNKSGEYVK